MADWAFQQSGGSFFPGGPLDETAHLLTALLLLQALPPRWRAKIMVPALIGSVAIDLDHIPGYLGYNFLTVGTPRPYTHSLLTPLLLLALALAVRRHRAVFLGLALGVMLHFFRDLAEGNGSGVSLLWPFSDHAFSYSHTTYLAIDMAWPIRRGPAAGRAQPDDASRRSVTGASSSSVASQRRASSTLQPLRAA